MHRIQNTLSTPSNINMLNQHKMGDNNSQFPSQLNTIHSSGTESILPKNNIKNEINISSDVNKLHTDIHQQQIENITQIFSQSGENITNEMVAKALNAGQHGSTQQQELNLRPESALVVLTLFEPNDIPAELLSAAAELVKDIAQKDLANTRDVRNILGKKQKELDKKLGAFLSNKGTEGLKDIVSRYQEKYVSPAIKQQLSAYFSDDVIANHPIDKFLLTSENAHLEQCISESITAYRDIDTKHYGDRYQHLNNMFRHIEHKIGIIMPLKVKMNLSECEAQDASKTPENKMNNDEVDGFPHQLKASSAGNISNSYNTTTTTNNYFNTAFPESIKQVSPHESTVNQEQELHSSNKTEKVNFKLVGNDKLLSQNTIKLPRVDLNIPLEEPLPDYDLSNHFAQNDQEINPVQSRHFIEPSNESTPWEPSSMQEEKTVQLIKDQFKLATELAQKSSQPVNINPKMASHYGSYLIDNKVPNGVRLTNNRELVQDKSTKEVETESPFTIKNASHYRASYISQDDKVVLSAEGLMTRNLNEKLAYVNKPQGE
ncbi:hypothetical protein NFC79_00885 [Providencia stuartii]|nr:hypothetical protein NFC79_00885 [Providencia stuartii]